MIKERKKKENEKNIKFNEISRKNGKIGDFFCFGNKDVNMY